MRFVIQQTRIPYSSLAIYAVKHVTYLAVSSHGKSNKGNVFRDTECIETSIHRTAGSLILNWESFIDIILPTTLCPWDRLSL
jgi:hypothetical protein